MTAGHIFLAMNALSEIKEVVNAAKNKIAYSILNSGSKANLINRYFYSLFDKELRRIGK